MYLPILTNKLYRVKQWKTTSGSEDSEDEANTVEVDSIEDANVVSSLDRKQRLIYADYNDAGSPDNIVAEDVHTPVLDIDVPASLVPSSTPGKHHLYIDVPMSWDDYCKLLDVMAEVGILEPGYVSASKARGFTAVRLPWVRK